MHLYHHSHPPRSTFIVGHSVEGRREGTPGIDKDLWNVALIQSSPKNALLGFVSKRSHNEVSHNLGQTNATLHVAGF